MQHIIPIRRAAVKAAPPPGAAGIVAGLLALGWRPGTPWVVVQETEAVFAKLCAALRCPGCRHADMEYRPFTDGRRWKVVAVCPCGHEVEVL